MTHPAFFGYGSLVNLNTHGYANPRTASVTGWRRIWHSLAGRDHAILSATPSADSTLHGIMADVPDGDWAALDAREGFYLRQSLPCGTAIYEVRHGIINPPTPHPILRSYLDVVAAGYLEHFGPDGVAHFFTTTDNWGPVLDDRPAPLYPRHQKVTESVTSLVDGHLEAVMEKRHKLRR